ncbi:membrane protein insertion efficiency factor YidD [Pinirhizobacter soli]|uniref:membrane protein insertion efficiency factor YidD n=1 Tax=Pinirhizobacter soli TaxID=2786953 RepID=UPI00202A40ED
MGRRPRISPSRLRDVCLFEPSCSNYAIEAIQRFGTVRGWSLAIARIRRCAAPNGGFDPVPPRP